MFRVLLALLLDPPPMDHLDDDVRLRKFPDLVVRCLIRCTKRVSSLSAPQLVQVRPQSAAITCRLHLALCNWARLCRVTLWLCASICIIASSISFARKIPFAMGWALSQQHILALAAFHEH